MAQSRQFKPQTLRIILFVVFILVLAAGGGLFYLGFDKIRTYAIAVNHSVADAQASATRVQALQTLKDQLAQSDSVTTKVNQLFAAPSSYQSQANSDVRNYAAAAGLTVSKVSFEAAATGSYPTMTIDLKAPVSYSQLIQFLNGVEGNIPKLLVTELSLSHVNGGDANSVAVDAIKIMVATR